MPGSTSLRRRSDLPGGEGRADLAERLIRQPPAGHFAFGVAGSVGMSEIAYRSRE
jgi:hypothetical protein